MQFAGDKPSAEDGGISDTDRSRSICDDMSAHSAQSGLRHIC